MKNSRNLLAVTPEKLKSHPSKTQIKTNNQQTNGNKQTTAKSNRLQ